MISLLHPSYLRYQMAYDTAINWFRKAKNRSNIEYILCLTSEDKNIDHYNRLFKDMPVRIITWHKANMVEQVNFAASKATSDLMIAISDDFDCPEHWDEKLLTALKDKKFYIVKTQDGIQPEIITLPIFDREWYNKFGFVYHPDFYHMYGDEWLVEVGKKMGRLITLDLLFPHLHYLRGHMEKDEVNEKNNCYFEADKKTFFKHKEQNFGL